VSGDDRSWNDGDKLSFSERDRMRREGRSSEDRRPRGVSQAKVDEASKQYVKKLDGIFSQKKGSAEVDELAAAMRAAHGTNGLAAACREYRAAAGLPDDPSLLGMFLDSGDPELVVGGLQALQSASQSGKWTASAGLRSQIRMLAEDRSDEVAELAEALAEQL
jgi:hypothetical protein